MEISEGLQKFIDTSLVDGKIDRNEKKVILKMADKEGLDQDMFKIYLNSKLQEKQIEMHKGLSEAEKERIEESKGNKKELIVVFLLLIVCFGVGGLWVLSLPSEESVTEKLEQFDFSGARKDASSLKCQDNWTTTLCPQTIVMIKIIKEEVTYMASNKEYGRAINAMSDVNTLMLYDELVEEGQISQDRFAFINSLEDIIINKAKANGDSGLQEIKNLK